MSAESFLDITTIPAMLGGAASALLLASLARMDEHCAGSGLCLRRGSVPTSPKYWIRSFAPNSIAGMRRDAKCCTSFSCWRSSKSILACNFSCLCTWLGLLVVLLTANRTLLSLTTTPIPYLPCAQHTPHAFSATSAISRPLHGKFKN